jgi:hypothetical protein
MTISFAAGLLAMIGLVAWSAMGLTFARYGSRVLALGREREACREFIEMRMIQRPTAPLRAAVPLRAAATRSDPRWAVPLHVELRAAA